MTVQSHVALATLLPIICKTLTSVWLIHGYVLLALLAQAGDLTDLYHVLLAFLAGHHVLLALFLLTGHLIERRRSPRRLRSCFASIVSATRTTCDPRLSFVSIAKSSDCICLICKTRVIREAWLLSFSQLS